MDENIDIQWYIDQSFGNPFDLTPKIEDKLIINAAISGMIPGKRDTPHVPISPEEIIADTIRCYKAGASIVHLHVRDENGKPTYKASAYEEIIPQIRKKCKGIIICVTTSGRIIKTFKYRSQVLNLEGDCKPDMASLALGSMNFTKQASINSPRMIERLASLMLEKGIKPELEIFETGMINYATYLKRYGLLKGTLYFNFLLGSLGTMPARISDLDHLISTLPDDSVWAGAGIGRFQLPVNITSIIKGGHVRVGLEDTIYFDSDKKVLATNEQLIKRLVEFSKKMGRDIAASDEARTILGLKDKNKKV
jgi:uncharacterized protein (DUF849 family)